MIEDSKRKINIKFVLAITLALLVLFTVASRAVDHFKFKSYIEDNFTSDMTPAEENKYTGEVESRLKTTRKYVVNAHYPSFESPEASKIIGARVDKYIEDFKKSSSEVESKDFEDISSLHIDYRSFAHGEKIASIILDLEENIPAKNLKTKASDILVVDLENGEVLHLDDIIIEEGYDFISRLTKNQFLENNNLKPHIDEDLLKKISAKESYNDFIVKDEVIEFIFPGGSLFPEEFGTASSQISLEELEDYTKFDLAEAKTLDEAIIAKKIEAANFKGAIRPGLDPNKPMIALTFDDGPYGPTTGPIIDVLEQYDSAATFFVLGSKLEAEADLVKRAADNGNEISNHSLSHKLLTAISDEELFHEIDTTQDLIEDVSGYQSTLLRPTYGEHNANMKEKLDLPFILWSIDTMDWHSKNAGAVVNHVLSRVRDGDIVLMHDIYPSTTQATQILVPELINRGFQLVTISELFALKEIELESGETYTDAVGY